MHLAAPDVHVVGERVGQLHRDRPDLAPDAAEVVEEARPLARELGEERCEPEHVHRGESIPLVVSGASSSGRGGACLEPPLVRGLGALRRDARARDGEGCPQLLHEPLDRQLAISQLAPLVLRDRPQHRAGASDDALLLRVRECAPRLRRRTAPRRGSTISVRAGRRVRSSETP